MEIKERPILFNADMVRAILDGRKTQTRRLLPEWQQPIKPDADSRTGEWMVVGQRHPRYGFGIFGETEEECIEKLSEWPSLCPFGKPGDRVWVRETTESDEETCDTVVLSKYAADGAPVLYSGCEDADYNGSVAHWDYPRHVRPSIHMPRWACRILLEITAVRVERLWQMQCVDVPAEGFDDADDFRNLWRSTYGADNWDANPWVWVIEFKRI